METGADDLTSLLSIILIGIIFFILILIILPRIGNFSTSNSEADNNNPLDSDLHPLQKIFVEYRHSSVSDWINWIKIQDNSRKNLAFNNLISYLKSEPEGIGSLVTDVIKAVIAFAYPESFTSLHALIENVRKRWGAYHTADQFYGPAVLGLVELNQERSQSILISEFELIKNKRESKRFMIAIMNALNQLTSNEELNEFWFQALVDPFCDASVKEHAVKLIANQDTDSKISIITPFFKFWINSKINKISENDIKIIENMFYSNQDVIINENYDLWSLALEACEQRLTEKLFIELVNSLLENRSIEIKDTLLLQLFKPGYATHSKFLETLSVKQALSDEERLLIQEEYLIHNQETENIINVTKYFKNKDVAASLEDTYEYLIRALSLNQESKNQNFPVINFMPGISSKDKYYLTECLAANHGYKVLNVNLTALLNSIPDLAKIKVIIGNSKPCLIYFYGLSELMDRKLSDVESSSIEILNKLFKEFKVTTGVNFLIDLEMSHEDLNHNNELLEFIKKVFQQKYGQIKNINKPDLLGRQKIFNDHIKKLAGNRIKSSAGLELIAKQTEGYSLIEFLAYINHHIKTCLLVYGELKSPADLKAAANANIEEVDDALI